MCGSHVSSIVTITNTTHCDVGSKEGLLGMRVIPSGPSIYPIYFTYQTCPTETFSSEKLFVIDETEHRQILL